LTDLEKQLEIIEDKIKFEDTYLSIIKEELSFFTGEPGYWRKK